jgi:hypothetical protein
MKTSNTAIVIGSSGKLKASSLTCLNTPTYKMCPNIGLMTGCESKSSFPARFFFNSTKSPN